MKFILFLTSVFLAAAAQAQFDFVPAYPEQLSGPVKKIQKKSHLYSKAYTWEFNHKGQPLLFQFGGYTQKFSYDTLGQLINVQEYKSRKHTNSLTLFWEGSLLRYQTETNPSKNLIISKVEYIYNADNLCIAQKKYTLDDNNQLKLVVLDSFYYDSQKRLSTHKQNMGFLEEFLTIYTPQGLIHRCTNVDLSMWREFQYNNAGQRTGYTDGYSDIIESQTVYELDKYGNWIKATTTYLQDKVNHPKPYVDRQIIEYYP